MGRWCAADKGPVRVRTTPGVKIGSRVGAIDRFHLAAVMYEKLTPLLDKVIKLSQRIARDYDQDYVGTEQKRFFHFENGKVRIRIPCDTAFDFKSFVIAEFSFSFPGIIDDMKICRDLAALIDDEAGAETEFFPFRILDLDQHDPFIDSLENVFG